MRFQTISISALRQENMVPKRGLEPDSSVQTFSVSLSSNFRQALDRLTETRTIAGRALEASSSTQPMSMGVRTAGAAASSHHLQARSEAFHNRNKFLSSFLEHGLKDFPYKVKEKLWFESLLDMELQEQEQSTSVFHSDPSAQFDSLFFRGIEFHLWIAEFLFFLLLDLNTRMIGLSCVSALMFGWLLAFIRGALGRAVLARSSLLDYRFLA